MVYLLRVRFSGWSLRIILQHGGGGAWGEEAFSPSPSMLTPYYSPRNASTTVWRGEGSEVEETEEADFDLRLWVFTGRLALLLFS